MKLDYKIIRSSRKTMALQIKDGEILVRAPEWVPDARIDDFVNDHRDWIRKRLEEQEEEREAEAGQLKEMNHSSRFYDEVYRAFPEYDKWNKWLKDNGTRYMNMVP